MTRKQRWKITNAREAQARHELAAAQLQRDADRAAECARFWLGKDPDKAARSFKDAEDCARAAAQRREFAANQKRIADALDAMKQKEKAQAQQGALFA